MNLNLYRLANLKQLSSLGIRFQPRICQTPLHTAMSPHPSLGQSELPAKENLTARAVQLLLLQAEEMDERLPGAPNSFTRYCKFWRTTSKQLVWQESCHQQDTSNGLEIAGSRGKPQSCSLLWACGSDAAQTFLHP